MASLCFAEGEPQDNVICIMTGTTVLASGTSTYIIDLNNPMFGYRPLGDFSLQFKGFTHDAVGGATVNAAWRGCNYLPVGVRSTGLLNGAQTPQGKMASTTIVSNMNVENGNTEYVYGFFYIDPVRYMLIDITAGVSNLGVSAYVVVQ